MRWPASPAHRTRKGITGAHQANVALTDELTTTGPPVGVVPPDPDGGRDDRIAELVAHPADRTRSGQPPDHLLQLSAVHRHHIGH